MGYFPKEATRKIRNRLTAAKMQILAFNPLSIGIYGLDFYVVLERAGYNINQRRKQKSTIGPNHRVTQEEAMKW